MITSYDTDFARWAIETAGALRTRHLNDVNIDAVAEEIESLGKADLREMESRIEQILEHRLKLDLVQGLALDYNRRGWTASIQRQRRALASLFKQSPSLRSALTDEQVAQLYPSVADIMAVECDVTPQTKCPYTAESIYTE